MPLSRIPSLNWLRVFEAAARAQSFARAAEALNMSAPAVSQQIRALEGYLGKPLFRRAPQHVELTEAGRAFLPVVGNALTAIEASSVSLFGLPDVQPLTIRVSAMLACSWLADHIRSFEEAHPEVQLTLVSGVVSEDFGRAGADLMITFGQPPGPGEQGDRLFGERLTPVALPDVAGHVRDPADLVDYLLIEISSHRATWYRLLPEPETLPTPPRFTYTDTTAIALALAGSGAGIALARAPASDRLVALYGLQPCLPELTVDGLEDYYLVYPAGAPLSPAAAAFRTWVLKKAGVAV